MPFSDPTYTAADWRAIVEWLKAGHDAGIEDSVIVVGRGKVASQAWAEKRAAELIGRSYDEETGTWGPPVQSKFNISDTLRDKAAAAVQDAIKTGADVGALNAVLAASFGDIAGRSLMIARTEMANAYNLGATANYADMGVTHVEVMDGGNEGSCDECNEVNGQVWTVEEAAANPTAHPNCGRGLIPVIPDSTEA